MSGAWMRGARRTLAQLRPLRVPEAPALAFRDVWQGDASRGQALLGGALEVAGTERPLPPDLGTPGGSPAWRAGLHGFSWLRDLRALGTDAARLRARHLVQAWLARGAADPVSGVPEVAGARLAAWLGHWDFVAATAEDGLPQAMLRRLAADARNLSAGLPAAARHRGALVALKGALAAAVALSDETTLARALRLLPEEVDRQVLPDGAHAERSPAALMGLLQDLIEIRNGLHGAGVEAPPALSLALDRAAPALRLFRHADGHLARFNGTREEPPGLVDLVLTHAQARGRTPLSLPEGGFERLQAGRTLVVADCGAPPARGAAGPGGLAGGADRNHHAGTLSFEMSVGRERLIVNCGALPAEEGGWRDALRATAAHSTLVLADTNSAELVPEGLGRRPEQVSAARHEENGAQWLEASHDGWRRGHGAVHRRTLYLSETGDQLRAEDVVEAESPPGFAVRFHLHPGVSARPAEDGLGALLRLPSGAGWRLRAGGGTVGIEESVSAAGERVASLQVVISASPGTTRVQWALSRVPASAEA